MQKGVLDQVPQLIEMVVIGTLLLAILSRRNVCLHAQRVRLLNDGITVIALVGEQVIRTYPLDQFASMRTIRVGTWRNKCSDWHTMRIHGQMQLRSEPPFVRPIA